MLAAIVNLNGPDHYIHWGFILISLANFLVIVAMLVLFVLALTLPFLHARRVHRRASQTTSAESDPEHMAAAASAPMGTVSERSSAVGSSAEMAGPASAAEMAGPAPVPGPASASLVAPAPSPMPETAGDQGLWTSRLRRLWLRRLPPDKLLPDSQPAYVASWIYVFGVLTLAGFLIACLSGLVLALEGPIWWHTSSVGHFFNSLHMWSVECFMGFMAIHLWGKFWMASWRGKRALTWMTGVVAFLVSVFEAFTGYLSQTNFDSQWIAFEAKDAMNAGGIGAFFNTMNFGQALMLHIVFVPLVLVIIIAIHIVMVRLRGVSHPIDANPEHLEPTSTLGTAPAGLHSTLTLEGAPRAPEPALSRFTVGATSSGAHHPGPEQARSPLGAMAAGHEGSLLHTEAPSPPPPALGGSPVREGPEMAVLRAESQR